MKKYLKTIRWYIAGTIATNFIEAIIIAHNLEEYADQFDEQIRICREA